MAAKTKTAAELEQEASARCFVGDHLFDEAIMLGGAILHVQRAIRRLRPGTMGLGELWMKDALEQESAAGFECLGECCIVREHGIAVAAEIGWVEEPGRF